MASLAERSKDLFRRYGKIALGVHLTVYAGFFTGCYVAIENHVDVKGPLQKIGLLSSSAGKEYDDTAEQASEDKGWLDKLLTGSSSSLALAFLCNKALFPVRTPITLALTPAVAR
ncbi:hypothetical protein CHLNCDRAFT_24886 [Chlorella variabilis]|uniref:DUF1279 domain-containing protein n=1 Tax=Chlorella variabilis TaxID=554065 RepID=E1ZIF3_CHLVA|nr:hypothetical protein CHLNCDRAFT_24886 [Chlorella variabilis]EFN54149.1 hypothetical protein CHLNCDRAFT_24886 [Chlorella variabilis]|eukprot:XP_005846251.1 hypothetical protein CHLNCDRAFT_24886 [Chlorella variabilis]